MLTFPIHNINSTDKILLMECLARYLDVPHITVDCTKLTQSGYEGDDVESIIIRLFQAAGYSAERAQTGTFNVVP
jgi:ATP-dependent Clp protease ATP-binding subunit ClpX